MAYGLFLSVDNGAEGFQLPINPGEIKMSEGNDGATYSIADVGEINVIKDKKLTEISFESFFPIKSYPFLVTSRVLKPESYVNYIENWMEKKIPIRFIFTGNSFDINILVSIETFEWSEMAGTMGDIEYSFTLKKYRNYAPKKVKVKLPRSQTAIIQKQKKQRPNTRKIPSTYRLVRGDSLWKVAEKFYNDGTKCWEIQRLNKIPSSRLRRLPIGLKIKLPAS